jgi:hypothetical protein
MRSSHLLLALLFAQPACSLPFSVEGGRLPRLDRGRADPEDSSAPKDTDPEGSAADSEDSGHAVDDTVESVPGVEDPSARIFALDAVREVDISLSAESISALESDPWTYVPGDLTFDGVRLANVGVRLKGRIGSYRSLSGKAGFKIDLNVFDKGRDFHGLERLTFSNMVQDPSFVHEPAAYRVYEAMGIKVPRIGYAWIRVNGQEFGLYENVEAYDENFLARVFEDPTGNFYDGDYYLWPDRSYTLIDFSTSSQDYFVLDEGVDVGLADIRAITAAIDATTGTDAFYETLGGLVNWERHLAFWAVENWVAQYDGYTYNSNNFRVYFNPATGLAEMLPWDHDWAFYGSTPLNSPRGRLSASCYAHPACKAAWFDQIRAVCATFDPGTEANAALVADIEARIALIYRYIDADPRKEVSADTARYYQRELLSWVSSQSSTLRAYWRL